MNSDPAHAGDPIAGAGESGRGGATNTQCAGSDYYPDNEVVPCCPGYECKKVYTEGPDYGAHFCTAMQCAFADASAAP